MFLTLTHSRTEASASWSLGRALVPVARRVASAATGLAVALWCDAILLEGRLTPVVIGETLGDLLRIWRLLST